VFVLAGTPDFICANTLPPICVHCSIRLFVCIRALDVSSRRRYTPKLQTFFSARCHWGSGPRHDRRRANPNHAMKWSHHENGCNAHNATKGRTQRGPRPHANLLFLLLTVASMLPCGFGRRSLVPAAAALPMPVSEPPPAFARAWPVTETPPVARVAPDACVGCFFIHSVF
jgi:hypothetical protein